MPPDLPQSYILVDILSTNWPILYINTSNERWDSQLSSAINDMLLHALMSEKSK